MKDEKLFLCYNYGSRDDSKRCRVGTDGPLGSFSDSHYTQHDHWRACQTNSDTHLMVVGSSVGWDTSGVVKTNKKAELFDTRTNASSSLPDFPVSGRNYWSFLFHRNSNLITFKGSEFLYYAPIYHENAFFIFGGKHWPDFFTKIARIDVETRLWSIVGDLRNPRMSHGVILIGNSFMVVGGYANIKSEKCTLENNRMNCVELASGLPGYVNHPYFAPVHSNFAEYCN